jgi:hypothetical protein
LEVDPEPEILNPKPEPETEPESRNPNPEMLETLNVEASTLRQVAVKIVDLRKRSTPTLLFLFIDLDTGPSRPLNLELTPTLSPQPSTFHL